MLHITRLLRAIWRQSGPKRAKKQPTLRKPAEPQQR